jgi:hypothetical protein
MRAHHAAFILFLSVPVLAQDNLGTYEDRIAVEDVMARYVWAVDSLDADGYDAVFTEDAKGCRRPICTTWSATCGSHSPDPVRRSISRTGRLSVATAMAG